MRKVVFTTKELEPHPTVGKIYKTVKKEGYFHCWGMSSFESSDGNVHYSVAIVECVETGKVKTLVPDEIIFIDKPE